VPTSASGDYPVVMAPGQHTQYTCDYDMVGLLLAEQLVSVVPTSVLCQQTGCSVPWCSEVGDRDVTWAAPLNVYTVTGLAVVVAASSFMICSRASCKNLSPPRGGAASILVHQRPLPCGQIDRQLVKVTALHTTTAPSVNHCRESKTNWTLGFTCDW
jgi:hypothetical protein